MGRQPATNGEITKHKKYYDKKNAKRKFHNVTQLSQMRFAQFSVILISLDNDKNV